ncbi:hypothetical protein PRUB_a0059 [Pseudoalteromonas rubra]|uniref:Uncharacterized protein n=1 Tax=Pseudoalteromonas rubra TaxID=43658 RepID=A0A8T0C4L1_9GAMM|nr:hypothetical protein PRUB_a0059 [Pseudoalteromonas rubra]
MKRRIERLFSLPVSGKFVIIVSCNIKNSRAGTCLALSWAQIQVLCFTVN